MASPRAIRIPRSAPRPTEPESTVVPAPPVAEPGAAVPVDRRRNQAATERAHRLTLIYLIGLAVLYGAFVLLDRSAPGGTTSAVQTGLLYFTGIAAGLGVGGAFVALSPAPRAIELRPDSLVVIEWWGHRRTFPPLAELTRSVVRRYPASFLSSRAVEAIELGTPTVGRRTYQFETGLIPTLDPFTRSPGA